VHTHLLLLINHIVKKYCTAIGHQKRYYYRGNFAETRPRCRGITAESVPVPVPAITAVF